MSNPGQIFQSNDLREPFAAGIKISLAAHALVFSMLLLKAVFLPDLNHEAVENAIHVDLVALPDKLQPDQEMQIKREEMTELSPPPVEPKPSEQTSSKELAQPKVVKENPTPKELEVINLDKVKQKQLKALQKLKEQSALDKIREALNNEETQHKLKEKNAAKLKGNILAAGNSLTGVTKLQHDSYVATLEQSIKSNFFLAEWLRKKQFKTVVRIRFNAGGKILGHDVVISSGNSSFDESAVEAVEKTAPFPPPPQQLVDYFESRGFEVEFTDR